jgi:hypothetical protein
MYAGRGLPPVHVSVHFNDQFVVGKTAVTLLMRAQPLVILRKEAARASQASETSS